MGRAQGDDGDLSFYRTDQHEGNTMNTRYSSEQGSAIAPPPLAWVARLLGWMGEAFRLSERSIGPVVDLLIRLRLAQVFFVSGVLKAPTSSTRSISRPMNTRSPGWTR